MELIHFRRDGRDYLARCLSEGRVVVVDFDQQQVILERWMRKRWQHHNYASPDGTLIAACGWYSRGIEFFDSFSGESRGFFRHSRPVAVWIDQTNRYVVSTCGTILDAADGSFDQKIKAAKWWRDAGVRPAAIE